jgi:ATP/maltotriose-dependent transcriptional regulator MalT
MSAYLTGNDSESVRILTRAHQSCVERRDARGAVRCAFWIGFQLSTKGDMAQAGGWLARGQRLLTDAGNECAEEGLLLAPVAIRHLLAGDAATAADMFGRAAEIGDRFDDPDVRVLARLGRGQALLRLGRTAEGLTLLDEVMVAVVAGDVAAMIVGLAYCAVIGVCFEIFDLPRAYEWTEALTQWCAAQPDLVPYRGQCLVHRAEVLEMRGSWADALTEADYARERLLGAPDEAAVGMAFAVMGDLQRLRGDFSAAEDAYRDASRRGHPPQPGLALLRLAQGKTTAAASMIARVVDEEKDVIERRRLLPAFADIMLAAGDAAAARAAGQELSALAERSRARAAQATADYCTGAVALADGDVHAARELLRRSWKAWQHLDVPYEAARTRVLIAQACLALGDSESADLELDAARWAFQRLGAEPDLERIAALSAEAPVGTTGSGLTGREIEILALVAAGKSNREVAVELVISEKTVARHLSNIFSKIGVASRSAATAYAFQHGLV